MPVASEPVISPVCAHVVPSVDVRTAVRPHAGWTKSMKPPPGRAERPPPGPPHVPGVRQRRQRDRRPDGGLLGGRRLGIAGVGAGVGGGGAAGSPLTGTDQTPMIPFWPPSVRRTRSSRARTRTESPLAAANSGGRVASVKCRPSAEIASTACPWPASSPTAATYRRPADMSHTRRSRLRSGGVEPSVVADSRPPPLGATRIRSR